MSLFLFVQRSLTIELARCSSSYKSTYPIRGMSIEFQRVQMSDCTLLLCFTVWDTFPPHFMWVTRFDHLFKFTLDRTTNGWSGAWRMQSYLTVCHRTYKKSERVDYHRRREWNKSRYQSWKLIRLYLTGLTRPVTKSNVHDYDVNWTSIYCPFLRECLHSDRISFLIATDSSSLISFLTFLDRTNVANAKLFGIERDINLSPVEYRRYLVESLCLNRLFTLLS